MSITIVAAKETCYIWTPSRSCNSRSSAVVSAVVNAPTVSHLEIRMPTSIKLSAT